MFNSRASEPGKEQLKEDRPTVRISEHPQILLQFQRMLKYLFVQVC
jgi:hypothetical protein